MEKTSKYATTNDIIFKYQFSNKCILKAFLEDFLDISIKTLEVKEQFNVHAKNFFEKACYLDIKAVVNKKKVVNLEMQNEGNGEYVQRIIIYHSALSREQVSKGDDYSKLKSIISINILNYILFDDINKYHTIWKYREDEHLNHLPLNGDEIHFIELPKFRKTIPNFENKCEQWFAYIDDSNPSWVKEVMSRNKTIVTAKKLKDDFVSDKSNQALIDAYEIWCMDQNTRIKHAKEDGIFEGKTEKALEIAKNMIRENINIDVIVKTTGLSKNDILKI